MGFQKSAEASVLIVRSADVLKLLVVLLSFQVLSEDFFVYFAEVVSLVA